MLLRRMSCGRLLISPHPVAAHHSTSSSATLNSRPHRYSRGSPRPEVRGLCHSRGQTSGKGWWSAEVPEELGKQGKSESQSSIQVGDSRELGMGNPRNPALVPNTASTTGTQSMDDSRLAFGG